MLFRRYVVKVKILLRLVNPACGIITAEFWEGKLEKLMNMVTVRSLISPERVNPVVIVGGLR